MYLIWWSMHYTSQYIWEKENRSTEDLKHLQHLQLLIGKLKKMQCHLVVSYLLTLFVWVGYFVLLGQTVNWGERCRIKHLPTRLYLAVIKNESDGLQVWCFIYLQLILKLIFIQVTLKERDSFSQKADLDIIFRLFPVIEVWLYNVG